MPHPVGNEIPLHELERRFPDSSLFTNDFAEVPPDYVSTYHRGDSRVFEMLEKYGLVPKLDVFGYSGRPASVVRRQIFTDRFAPGNHSVLNSVYLYPDHPGDDNYGGEDLLLEVKVPPKGAKVFDAKVLLKGGSNPTEADVRAYWNTGIDLTEYLALSPEEKAARFSEPEVLLPKGVRVPPSHIRVCNYSTSKST